MSEAATIEPQASAADEALDPSDTDGMDADANDGAAQTEAHPTDAATDPAAGDQGSDDPRALRDYDIARQDRVVRSRMPALEAINERLVRDIEPVLSQMTRVPLRVTCAGTRFHAYEDFVGKLSVPSSFNLVKPEPLRGLAMVVCEPELIFMVIDALFGGTGKLQASIEGRVFSVTEQRVIRRIVDAVCASMARAWAPFHAIELQHVRAEMDPRFIQLAKPRETILSTCCTVSLGDRSASFHLCIPYATIEPIRDVLQAPLKGDLASPDQRWMASLATQIQAADITLVADLAHARTTVEQLLALQPGDFIELDLNQDIEVKVEGVPILACRYGTANGRYALKVQTILTGANAARPGATHEQ